MIALVLSLFLGFLCREAVFLQKASNENVIGCIEHWDHSFSEGSGLYCMSLELCAGGSVQDLLDKAPDGRLPLTTALRIVRQAT